MHLKSSVLLVFLCGLVFTQAQRLKQRIALNNVPEYQQHTINYSGQNVHNVDSASGSVLRADNDALSVDDATSSETLGSPTPLSILRAPSAALRSPAPASVLRSSGPAKVLVSRRLATQQHVDNVQNLGVTSSPVDSIVPTEESEELRLLREEQAKNAHYSFDSSIRDSINDHSITRQETRDGLALNGMYSYSDGYFRRTVHYEADQDGYRVTKEEIEPIGDGPQFNPKGTADVSSSLHGSYTITADDFVREQKKRLNVGETENQETL